MTTVRRPRTRRGVLLAKLEWSRTGRGYLVEGYTVTRPTRKHSGGYRVSGPTCGTVTRTFTEALEWVADVTGKGGR